MMKCSLKLNMSFEDIDFKLRGLSRNSNSSIKVGKLTKKYLTNGVLFNIYARNKFIDEDNTELVLVPIPNFKFFIVLLSCVRTGVLLPFCVVLIVLCAIYNTFRDLEKTYTLLDKNLRW